MNLNQHSGGSGTDLESSDSLPAVVDLDRPTAGNLPDHDTQLIPADQAVDVPHEHRELVPTRLGDRTARDLLPSTTAEDGLSAHFQHVTTLFGRQAEIPMFDANVHFLLLDGNSDTYINIISTDSKNKDFLFS
jgi:hypothetical protein